MGKTKQAKFEIFRAKVREERHQRKNKNQAAKHQDDGVDGAAADDGAGDGAVAPMSLDGAAAADGAADGAGAPVSLEEGRRQEAGVQLLLDWTDKQGSSRIKLSCRLRRPGSSGVKRSCGLIKPSAGGCSWRSADKS